MSWLQEAGLRIEYGTIFAMNFNELWKALALAKPDGTG
jgi:hypothetical protein